MSHPLKWRNSQTITLQQAGCQVVAHVLAEEEARLHLHSDFQAPESTQKECPTIPIGKSTWDGAQKMSFSCHDHKRSTVTQEVHWRPWMTQRFIKGHTICGNSHWKGTAAECSWCLCERFMSHRKWQNGKTFAMLCCA